MRLLSAIFKESCVKRGYRDRPVDCVRDAGVPPNLYSGTTLRGVYEGRVGESLGDQDWDAIAQVCFQPLTGGEPIVLTNITFRSGNELRIFIKSVNGTRASV